ncbi:hypothetical protein XELAEV_18041806mg [Xenopus laevis]|uniref:Uncharacterized protein n=1 Tax=Xenopus laevis TaxID=8355 RepID=A0A974H5F5_XENLA|nr:hypothetical protein XELAEV_18041806mg [Xenopus laevis]
MLRAKGRERIFGADVRANVKALADDVGWRERLGFHSRSQSQGLRLLAGSRVTSAKEQNSGLIFKAKAHVKRLRWEPMSGPEIYAYQFELTYENSWRTTE